MRDIPDKDVRSGDRDMQADDIESDAGEPHDQEQSGRPLRTRVLKGAHAAFNQEFSAIPCVVRDLSETGARLQFDEGWFVPPLFTLFVDVDGFKVECERVWHKGSHCGVRFLGDKVRIGSHRSQVLNPYDDSGADPEPAQPRPAWGAPPPVSATAPRRAVQFGKRTR